MKRLLLLVIALSLASTACVVRTYEVEHHALTTDEAPPEPRVEERPDPPDEGYQWVNGYWYWTGGRYVWVSGSWRRPPAAGHVWVGSGWVVYGGGYRYVPGRWSRPAVRPVYRYYHPRPVYAPRPAPRPMPRRY